MRPDQWVAIVGTLFCLGTIAAVRWGHPSTWCAWVDSWTRSDEASSREDLAQRMMLSAMVNGFATKDGWTVVRVLGGGFEVCDPSGRVTLHDTAYSAELRLLREM